ncbi:MAG: hypothetical protein AB3K77_02570 [Methanosarcinaceae archaeon]
MKAGAPGQKIPGGKIRNSGKGDKKPYPEKNEEVAKTSHKL